MGHFISDSIISEGGLTATTANITTISATTISGTTFYGDGSNLTNVPINVTLTSSQDAIVFNSGNTFSGHTSLEYSGGSLLITGTTRTNGQFFYGNSSAGLRLQWFGTQTAGTAPGIIWTNMPALPTTWLHQTSGTLTGDATYIVDLTEYTQFRFTFQRQVAGAAASNLVIQYSLDNSTWEVTPLVTLAVGTGTGARDSGWTTIPVGARTFIYIRLAGAGGNGTADPRFSPPTIIFR
jgi:hypothetical protein